MAEIFISYSRKDSEFARHLSNELHKHSRDVWIDWEDIPRGADWLNEIYASIEAADTFVLIVSQHSLTSEICNYEIAHARKFSKRIIPLIRQPIEGDLENIVKGTWVGETWEQFARANWQAIRHINWLHFAEDTAFRSEFEALLKTLDEDLPHLKAHTRYLVRALDWQRAAHNPSFLLVGDEISAAEIWLAASVDKKPEPDRLHRDYIFESRRADDERKARAAAMEQRITALGRRTRQFRLASLALAGMAALAIIAVVVAVAQGNEAREQVAVAQRDLVTATRVQIQAATAARELDNANATLAPIPSTLNAANVQISAGETQVAQVNSQAATAQTQVAIIGATLTPVPPTLTAVAVQIEEAINRSDILSLVSRAFIALNNEQSNEALQIASSIVSEYPEESDAHAGRGMVYYALGNFESAITDYTRAIELNPEHVNAYYNRGIAYVALGEYEQALADYSRAIELDPEDTDSYINRGVAYAALGEYEQALADYSHAIELNPEGAIGYYNRGTAYFDLGEYEQALADYSHAIELNPEDASAYTSRGAVYAALDEYEQAISDQTRALEFDPENATAYANRGAAYTALGEYEQALADYARAIELDPENATTYTNRGIAYSALGEYEQAITDYTLAIELNPERGVPYVARGGIFYLMGNYSRALEDWQTAEDLLGQLPPEVQPFREQLEANTQASATPTPKA